jgi:hypothetical protein
MSPKLVKLSQLGQLLGLHPHRMEDLVRSGKVRASRFSARSANSGHYYVTTTEACRVLRELMLEGADLVAGRRAVYRAAQRVHDSTHAIGLRPVGDADTSQRQVGKVTPGTE